MSGLHNKYPKYFYKRGNLFNTYLGHTEPPRQESDHAKKKSRRRTPLRPSAPILPRGPNEDLIEFVQYSLKETEGHRFLQLLAAYKHVKAASASRSSPWPALARFIRTHLTTQEAEIFLGELRRRSAAGEPPVRYASEVRSRRSRS